MRPSYHPKGLHEDSKVSARPISQTWHQNGKCPENTIPIRRIKEEDVLRASSIGRYGKKMPGSIPKLISVDDPVKPGVTSGHKVQNVTQESPSHQYYYSQFIVISVYEISDLTLPLSLRSMP
jgi:hypothetical protein